MYIIPTMSLKRGRQIKGTAKHKGAKGQSYKKNDKNKKIKTKAKTVNRNIDKRNSRIITILKVKGVISFASHVKQLNNNNSLSSFAAIFIFILVFVLC
jgi:hypothetical protein